MYRRQLLAIVGLVSLCLVMLLRPALASVGLVDFTAQPTQNNTIMLNWETATEDGTTGYKLYRSLTGSGSDWADLVPEGVPAQGTAQGGAQYSYEDKNDIVSGVRYYYLLREVTTGGDLVDLKTTSAGINVVEPTSTPTASPTWTRAATAVNRTTGSPTSVPRGPTATRRFTDGPPTARPTTPSPQATTAVAAPRATTPTPLPGASVATPTGPAPRVTLPGAPLPTTTPITATVTPFASLETGSPTPALVAIEEGTTVGTPTPRPTRDVTPIIFSAASEGDASPTPQATAEPAGRSNSLALVLGGSAVGLAGLIAAALLFMRSRRS